MRASDGLRSIALVDVQLLHSEYVKSLKLIEVVHRLLLDLVKDEFARSGQTRLAASQALLLFHIGDEGLTASELKTNGHFPGSNIAYHLRKLVDEGYVSFGSSSGPGRHVMRFCLTAKGTAARLVVERLFERQLRSMEAVAELSARDFMLLNRTLARLKRYWTDHVRYRL